MSWIIWLNIIGLLLGVTGAFGLALLTKVFIAIEPDGTTREYGFRADLQGYPAVAPEVRLWNLADNRKPTAEERPKGGPRVAQTFKDWGKGTVYRPWDRHTGPHGNNATTKPQLTWNPSRDLTFIFEDLHGILVSNGRKIAARSAA